MSAQITRRGFLKASAAGAASLFIGLNARGVLAAGNQSTVLNPFVRIDGDGTVTVIAKHFEMGQGTTTGLTTLVAEELDADWSTIQVDFAPADHEKYKNLAFGAQGTGGSTAIANSFMQYRQAGAGARALLVRAAAKQWGVDEGSISVSNSTLISGNRKGHFGDFIQAAAQLEAPAEPELKDPADFKLIGKIDLPRKDSSDKTDGTARFAMDVQLPGMLVAVVLRSPRFGGTLKSFDASKAKSVTGFAAAKALPNQAGVVVYGKNTWAAIKSREAISAEWDFSKAEMRSTAEMVQAHRDLNQSPQYQAMKLLTTYQATARLASAEKKVEAEFVLPFLAHAPMEPLVCVIEPTAEGITLHDGCQFPGIAHGALAKVLQRKPEEIEVKTLYAGGSFGRRATPTADYHVEAAMAFALMGQKVPVKLMWTREDDIRGGYYRPMVVHQVKAGLDGAGKPMAWDHRIASRSIIKGSPFESVMVHEGVDHTTVEGVADSLYNLPDMAVGVSDFESPITVLWWRSVGHSHTAFAMESTLDMLAHAAGKDPVELRLSLLDESHDKQRRLAKVIRTVRDASGWQSGQKRGFAAHYSFNSYVAMVADVTVKEKKLHVDRIHVAVDCGLAVNPDVVKAQMEGGIGYALSAVLRNEISFDKGQVVESNFPQYQPLRINDMPRIEVTIVASAEAPTGVGEPGVPPVAPAVANAVFAVSGERVTELPMSKAGFSFV